MVREDAGKAQKEAPETGDIAGLLRFLGGNLVMGGGDSPITVTYLGQCVLKSTRGDQAQNNVGSNKRMGRMG